MPKYKKVKQKPQYNPKGKMKPISSEPEKAPYSFAYNQALTNIESFKACNGFDNRKIEDSLEELKKKHKFINCFKFCNNEILSQKTSELMQLTNDSRNFFSHHQHDNIKLTGNQKAYLEELYNNAVSNVINKSNSAFKPEDLFDKQDGTLLSKEGYIFLVSLFVNRQTINSLFSDVLRLPNKNEKPQIYEEVQIKQEILSYYSRKTKFSLLGGNKDYEEALDIASYIARLPEFFSKETVDKIPPEYKKSFIRRFKEYGEANKLLSSTSHKDYEFLTVRQSNKFMEYALRYIESKNLLEGITFDAFDPDGDDVDKIFNRRYRVRNNKIMFTFENKKYSIDKRELYQLLYILLISPDKQAKGKHILGKIRAIQHKYVFKDLYELFKDGTGDDFEVIQENSSISNYYDSQHNNTVVYMVKNNAKEKEFIKGRLPKNWAEFFEANADENYSQNITEKIKKRIQFHKDRSLKPRIRVFDKIQNILDLWIFLDRSYHPYEKTETIETKRLTSGEYNHLAEYIRYPIKNVDNLKSKFNEMFEGLDVSKYWQFPDFREDVDMIEELHRQAIIGWNNILDDLLNEASTEKLNIEKFKKLLKMRGFSLNKTCPEIIKPDNVNQINIDALDPKLVKDGKVVVIKGIAQELWGKDDIRISKAILEDNSVELLKENYPLLFTDTFPALDDDKKWLKGLNKKIYDIKVEDKLLGMILKEFNGVTNPINWFKSQEIKIASTKLTYSDYKRIEGRISQKDFENIIKYSLTGLSVITYETISDKLKELKERQKSVINQILAQEKRLGYEEPNKEYTSFRNLMAKIDLEESLKQPLIDMRNTILHTNYDKAVFYDVAEQDRLLSKLSVCNIK